MTIRTFTCSSKKTEKSVAAILALAFCILPTISQAAIVCEKGQINLLKLASGGKSKVFISTDGGVSSTPKEWADGMLSTVIEYDENDPRWRDRLSLLRMAFAMQQPIKITANDGSDCIGLTDEFTVLLCQPGKC